MTSNCSSFSGDDSEKQSLPSSKPSLGAKELRNSSRRRRSDTGPDAFQPHNRLSAMIATGMSGCLAAAGVAICVATRKFHWAGLVLHNLSIVLSIAALVWHRSRRRFWSLGFAFAAIIASLAVSRWGFG
jgi:hypothetical protein